MIYSDKWTDWDTSDLADGDSLSSIFDTSTETGLDFIRNMDDSPWPNPDRGADIIIGFTDRRITATSSGTFTDQFVDARNGLQDEPIVLIGTNDLLTPTFAVDNYLQHELGHIFGAAHTSPTNADNMCKEACASNYDTFDFVQATLPGLKPTLFFEFVWGNKKNIGTTTHFSTMSKRRMVSDTKFIPDIEYRPSIRAISTRSD